MFLSFFITFAFFTHGVFLRIIVSGAEAVVGTKPSGSCLGPFYANFIKGSFKVLNVIGIFADKNDGEAAV